jgi:preprotein translocase subunit SecY
MFPATLANFSQVDWLQAASSFFQPGSIAYALIFVGLIIFFCFFYTAIIFDPKDIAENLKKQGGFIPGIRPGQHTKEYIDKVLTRITLWGSLYVSAICVLPMLLINKLNVPFYFGGTALLIVVGVAIDTMSQVQSYLITHQYEGLMQKSKLKGRF